MTESPSQALLDQAKLELEVRHPQATRLPASRHTRLRDGQLVTDMQLANMGVIGRDMIRAGSITAGKIRRDLPGIENMEAVQRRIRKEQRMFPTMRLRGRKP